ncbi:MAG TPA: DUF4885 family protein [Desulfosporosinus sp.]|nr:DUF4885 family protein [Desulfosporosinus sp.]
MNINSISTPTITPNSINQTTQGKTIIQTNNGWVSEADKRIQALTDNYRKINEQNKQFNDPMQHIQDKYVNINSPYFRSDLTETERDISLHTEGSWLHNGGAGCYYFGDSFFRSDSPSTFNGDVEVAERKGFNRQKVNDQLKQLLDKYQINIPNDTLLTFTIDPNNYKLTVSGTDDIELSRQLEQALNTADNVKELFVHIIQSRSYNNTQFTREKSEKNDLVTVIKNSTGYDLKNLAVVNGKFVTKDGIDILELYKNSLLKNNPYAGILIEHYGSQLSDLAKNGFDSIPDLFLSIGYGNGSLQDIGQKENYGTGKKDWIKELKASVDSLNK